MSFIPLSPDAKLVHKIEGTDSEIHFRYLLGEYQDRFLDVQERIDKIAKPHMEQARKNIKKRLDEQKKKPSRMEMEQLVHQEAMAIANQNVSRKDQIKYGRDLVDIFVCGWKGEKFPSFPENGKASSALTIGQVNYLVDVLSKHMAVLTGLDIDDLKN